MISTAKREGSLSTPTWIVLLTAIYVLSGVLGKEASFLSGSFQLVWPPFGIALAVLLRFGLRFWPMVALGTALFAFVQGFPLGFFTLAAVVGNTVGAVLCQFLLERFVGFRNDMTRVRDVAGLVGFACLLGTTFSAASTTVCLAYQDKVPWLEMLPTVVEWWLPNAMAGLVVTPFLLAWFTGDPTRVSLAFGLEMAVCSLGLLGATSISFNSWYAYGVESYPLAFLPYPFLVWAALRFGQRGATSSTLLVSVLAIHSLLNGRGPFVAGTEKESLMLMGSYIGILAVTNMMLAAAALERRRVEGQLLASQEMFELISNSVADYILVSDLAGRTLHATPSCQRLLGDGRRLADVSLVELAHPEDRLRVQEALAKAGPEAPAERVEFRLPLPDGRLRHLEAQISCAPAVRGQPPRVVAVARDITERIQHEESLRLLASAIQFADDAIMIAGPDPDLSRATVAFVNPAFGSMTGYTAEEVVGRNPTMVYGTVTETAELQQLQRCLAEGKGYDGEVRLFRRDGVVLQAALHVEPIRDSAGQVTHTLIVQRDVTRQRQVERDLARARDEALMSAQLKAEFLANMSHEIRTPMNGIIGLTNLLLQTDLSGKQRDFAEHIRSSSDALLTVINDILDFSKIEAGKLALEQLDFELISTVESAIELLAQAADQKGLELTGFVYPDVPTRLRGDSGRLWQILNNLVSNAVKFTAQGEVTLVVTRQSETERQVTLRFEVRDTGIGIAEEVQAKLFRPFSQADGSTTRRFGGTGLGLAICRQLVELMEGSIGLESAPGRGTTFWCVIAFEKQEVPAPAPAIRPDLEGCRILIVDDHSTPRLFLRAQLSAWRLRSEGVASVAEAERLLQSAALSDPFGLLMVDVRAETCEGLSRLRARGGGGRVPEPRLLAMVPWSAQHQTAPFLAAGANACLPKPIKQSRLVDGLNAALDQTFRPSEAAPPAQSETPSKRAPAPEGRPEPPAPRRQLRILLAEDNPINQKVAVTQMEQLGYSVTLAVNGRDAVQAFVDRPFDLILMDCQMPEMDGYEATRQIRRLEQEARPHGDRPVRIIAMTANAMTGDRQRCLDAGMDDYLSKPVEMEELEAVLTRLEAAAKGSPAAVPEAPLPAPAPASVPAPATSAPASVDWKRLRKVCLNDPQRMREMVEIYLGQSDELMAAIRAAVAAGNAKQLSQMAHKLAGASASSGMTGVVAGLRRLEALGQEEKVGEAPPLLAPLETQLSGIQSKLRDYLREAPAAPPPPAMAAPEDDRLIDWPRLQGICLHDQQRVRELVEMYVAQSEELLQNLQAAVDTGQARLFEQCAHRLRGTSATFGVHAVAQALQELELACVSGHLADVAPRMPALRDLLGRSNRLLLQLAVKPPPAPAEAAAPSPRVPRSLPAGPVTAAAPPASPDESLIDLTRLQRACQGDAQRVRDMLELYLAQSGGMLHSLAAAVADGATDRVQQTAHQWASASQSCGVVGMVGSLRELEACGREQRLEALTEHYHRVSAQYERVAEALRSSLSLPAGEIAGSQPT